MNASSLATGPLPSPAILLCGFVLCFFPPLAFAADPDNQDAQKQLRLEKFVLPDFPPFARLSGVTRGLVTVAIGRNAEGQVTDILVLDSTNALLSEATTNAIAQWKFARPSNQPIEGQPVVPIVRFIFNTGGVSIISAATGRATAKIQDPAVNAPVVLPALSEIDDGPKPLFQPMPQIRGAAASTARGGTATVKFFVDDTGRARVPIVLECSSPELGEAAVLAVEQWRDEPPFVAGHPTIAIEAQTFTFGTRTP